MRLYDSLVRDQPSFPIGVIGSCRGHHPLPIQVERGVMRSGWLDGFVTHTSGEALQNLEFNLGKRELAPELMPFVNSRPEASLGVKGSSARIGRVPRWIMEISSARSIKCGNAHFQQNFFARNFVRKFGPPLMPWWRAVSLGRKVTEDIVATAMAGLGASGVASEPWMEAILRNATLAEDTPEQVYENLAAIKAHLPNAETIMIVSHFVVEDDASSTTAMRRTLNEQLRDICRQFGFLFFDPTVLVSRYGRETALADDGVNIYEYSRPFNDVVSDELMKALGTPTEDKKSAAVAGGMVSSARDASQDVAEMVEGSADRVQSFLLSFAKDRLQRMGAEASGLLNLYEVRVERGKLLTSRDKLFATQIMQACLDYYTKFVCYRSGLGELVFTFYDLGIPAIGFEPARTRRNAAIDAGKRLVEQGMIDAPGPAFVDKANGQFAAGGRAVLIGNRSLWKDLEAPDDPLKELLAECEGIALPVNGILENEPDVDIIAQVRQLNALGFKRADFDGATDLFHFRRS